MIEWGIYRVESPWWLGLLLLLPIWAWLRGRPGKAAAVRFSSAELLRAAGRGTRSSPGRFLAAFRFLAVVLLIAGLSRPQREKGATEDESEGINIMLTLDFSSTMATTDFTLNGRRVSRLDGLKAVCAEFIRSRLNDRIGLTGFSSNAFLMSPLTLDHDWLVERLEAEKQSRQTALGSGLLVGAAHLQTVTNETRIQILMTDAANVSDGPPLEAVGEAIRPLGIRSYFIQIIDYQGRNRRNDVSEALTRIARATGGQFFQVSDVAGLRAVYAQIDRLEKSEFKEKKQKSYAELFHWLVLPGLGLVLLEVWLSQTWWRRLP